MDCPLFSIIIPHKDILLGTHLGLYYLLIICGNYPKLSLVLKEDVVCK